MAKEQRWFPYRRKCPYTVVGFPANAAVAVLRYFLPSPLTTKNTVMQVVFFVSMFFQKLFLVYRKQEYYCVDYRNVRFMVIFKFQDVIHKEITRDIYNFTDGSRRSCSVTGVERALKRVCERKKNNSISGT